MFGAIRRAGLVKTERKQRVRGRWASRILLAAWLTVAANDVLAEYTKPLNEIASDILAAKLTLRSGDRASYPFGTFRFAVLTDTHLHPSTNPIETSYYGEILVELKRQQDMPSERISAVVITGDLYDKPTAEEVEYYYETIKAWMEASAEIDGERIPIFHTVGNHDTSGAETEIAGMDRYAEWIGDPDYFFDFENTRFLIVDNTFLISGKEPGATENSCCSFDQRFHGTCNIVTDFRTGGACEFGSFGILEDQLANVDEALSGGDHSFAFAFTHASMTYLHRLNEPNGTPVHNGAKYFDLLARHHVTATFSGHLHHTIEAHLQQGTNGAGLFNVVQRSTEQYGDWTEVEIEPHEVTLHMYDSKYVSNSQRVTDYLCDPYVLVEHLDPTDVTTTPYSAHFRQQVRVAGNGTSYDVESSADVTVTAGNAVHLRPGFSVAPGATFHSSTAFPTNALDRGPLLTLDPPEQIPCTDASRLDVISPPTP